jgi:hypothetical protein
MKDYVERMIKEELELSERIEKLSKFLEEHKKDLPLEKRNLMTIQLHAMISYDLTLVHRIALEKSEEEKEKK